MSLQLVQDSLVASRFRLQNRFMVERKLKFSLRLAIQSRTPVVVTVLPFDKSRFKTCISEYSFGSNKTGEVNWIAVQSVPSGTQMGTTSLNSWTTGTECKRIDFPQVSSIHF